MQDNILKDRFDTDGFVGPISLWKEDEMLSFSNTIHAFINNQKAAQDWYSSVVCEEADSECPVETIYDAHWQSELIRNLCKQPQLIELLEGLMGAELCIWRTTFWIKEPGARRVEWHQDTYKEENLGSFPNINAWVALDEAPEDNCLWFCKGTHNSIIDLVTFKQETYVAALKQSEQLPFPPIHPQSEIIKMPLSAGQCVVFDGRTLHGSPPNKTAHRRAGIVIRFIPKNYKLSGFSGEVMNLGA